MTVKTILTEPNTILRQISQPVEHVGENAIGMVADDPHVRQFLHHHCENVGGAEGRIIGEENHGLRELLFAQGLQHPCLDGAELLFAWSGLRPPVMTNSLLVDEAAGNLVNHGIG